MKSSDYWVWIFILLAGLVLGGFIGDVLSGYQSLSWLAYGKEFGLAEPLVLDFYIFKLTFALTIRINIASIVGLFLAMLMYKMFKR